MSKYLEFVNLLSTSVEEYSLVQNGGIYNIKESNMNMALFKTYSGSVYTIRISPEFVLNIPFSLRKNLLNKRTLNPY